MYHHHSWYHWHAWWFSKQWLPGIIVYSASGDWVIEILVMTLVCICTRLERTKRDNLLSLAILKFDGSTGALWETMKDCRVTSVLWLAIWGTIKTILFRRKPANDHNLTIFHKLCCLFTDNLPLKKNGKTLRNVAFKDTFEVSKSHNEMQKFLMLLIYKKIYI